MAFKTVGSLNPHGGPVLKTEIITNSINIQIGDEVNANGLGFVALGTSSTLLFGNLVSIIDINGVGVDSNGLGGNFTLEFTTGSTNSTTTKVAGIVDVSKMTLYSVDPDATVGTTTGSNLLGYHTDLNNEKTTSESGAVDVTAQFHIWGLDPVDSTNQLVNLYESRVFGV